MYIRCTGMDIVFTCGVGVSAFQDTFMLCSEMAHVRIVLHTGIRVCFLCTIPISPFFNFSFSCLYSFLLVFSKLLQNMATCNLARGWKALHMVI